MVEKLPQENPYFVHPISIDNLPGNVLDKARVGGLPLTELETKLGVKYKHLRHYFFKKNGTTIDCISVNVETNQIEE